MSAKRDNPRDMTGWDWAVSWIEINSDRLFITYQKGSVRRVLVLRLNDFATIVKESQRKASGLRRIADRVEAALKGESVTDERPGNGTRVGGEGADRADEGLRRRSHAG